tara:strand:+ start:2281 stop:3957 length:1677 start_codon:yes stop_codon:yes gene_type:complete
MADTIVVVGNEVGDDYSTFSAALSNVPADITLTAGNHVIEIREGASTSNYYSSAITDATHRLIFRAFAGDEVNGKGQGAKIESGSGLGVIRTNGTPHLDIEGLLVNQTGTSRCILYGNGDYPVIKNCMIRSTSGTVIEVGNGQGKWLDISNTILLTDTGNCTNAPNTNDFTTKSFINVTAIVLSGTGYGINQKTSTLAQERKTLRTNCLTFTDLGAGFLNNGELFDSDFNASSDTSATGASITTSYTSRLIATDLEDPNGATPDYNLKATSTLKGAGFSGADIGAVLGATPVAVDPSSSTSYTIPAMAATSNIVDEEPNGIGNCTYVIPSIVHSITSTVDAPDKVSSADYKLPSIITTANVTDNVPDGTAVAYYSIPAMLNSVNATNAAPDSEASVGYIIPTTAIVANTTDITTTTTISTVYGIPSMNYSAAASVFETGEAVTGIYSIPYNVFNIDTALSLPDVSSTAEYVLPSVLFFTNTTDGAPINSNNVGYTLPVLDYGFNLVQAEPGADTAVVYVVPSMSISVFGSIFKPDYTIQIDTSSKTIQTTLNAFTIQL